MDIKLIHEDDVLLRKIETEGFEMYPPKYEVIQVGDKCKLSVGEMVLYLESIPGAYEMFEDTYYIIKEELLQAKLK